MSETKAGPVLLLAGTYRQARYWADQWNLGDERRDWVYISSVLTLKGRHNPRILQAGTPWTRKDYDELMREIAALRAVGVSHE